MSAEFAIALSLLFFASNYACFRIGQMNILAKFERHHKRQKEREARWEEFDDED